MNGDAEDGAPAQLRRWPLRFQEIEVPAEHPWEQDRLDRKRYGDVLTKLVERTATPFVLALDSEWGTGKTTFVKMWRQDLENRELKTLYFNAWETDYIAEPLVALVGEMGVLGADEAEDRFKRVKELAGQVLRKGVPILARVATGGLLNLDDKDVEDAVGTFVEDVVEERIEKYEEKKQTLVAFREALEELVCEIADERPLVFFIDELDRCRPSFAVELLERLKHLFEVPGIFFVLSTDRSQLAHSVRAVYGEQFDGEEYLRRFVDLTYVLPEPPSNAFVRHLLESAGIRGGIRTYFDSADFLMGHLKFNLRQQQRAVTLLAVAARCLGDHETGNPVLPALVILRVWRPSLFQGFLLGRISAAEVLEAFEAEGPESWRSPRNYESPWIEAGFLWKDLFASKRISGREVHGASIEREQAHRQAADKATEGEATQSWSSEVVGVLKGLLEGGGRYVYSWQAVFDAVNLSRGFVVEE